MRTGAIIVPRRWRAVASAAALLGLVGTAGCDDPSVVEMDEDAAMDERQPVDDGVLELGQFAEARTFVAYQPGEVERIEMGLQGGFHIFVDGRLRPDADLDEMVVELVVTLIDGGDVTRIRHQRVPDIHDADDWPTLPEMIIFIPDPAAVEGKDVRIEASIEALDGTLIDTVETELFLVSE